MKFTDLSKDFLSNFQDYDNHEIIRRFEDEETGLLAFVGVHNTNLGPALGGGRVRAYKDEDEAISDVLRLSRGMTYKSAAAGMPLGGGKAVILADPYNEKTPEMISAMGRAIDTLGGKYISAEDSGITEADVALMHKQTPYVTGFPDGSPSGLGGDPSPATAHGLFCAMREALKFKHNTENFKGVHVAIQGLGAVGYGLCRILNDHGAKISACDMREDVIAKAQNEFDGINNVGVNDIFDVDADVFAPCAMGAQLNDLTIPRLKVDIIAGAANNQLATPHHGKILSDRGILYAPDYIVNCGGVVSVGYEYFQRSDNNPFDYDLTHDKMMDHVEQASKSVSKIFAHAEAENILPHEAADRYGESIFMDKPLAA